MTVTKYKDAVDVTHEFQQEAGDNGGSEVRPVAGMPSAVRAQFTAMAASLVAIDANTNTVEALIGTTNSTLSTIDGRVDGLEALIGTTNSTLSTIDGRVDGLEALIGTTNSSLDPGTCVTNQTSSTTTSAAFSSQACTLGAWVKNISTSNQIIYVKMNATATSGNGYQLTVGEERFFPCANMTEINHIASATGANTCWEAI
jgi:hypothetical protein